MGLYPCRLLWHAALPGTALLSGLVLFPGFTSFGFQIPRSLPVCPVFPMRKVLHNKEKSICLPEKQDAACSWERVWGPYPSFSSSCRVTELTTAPPALPALLAPRVPQEAAASPFSLRPGKEGGNSKAKGKNKTTKHCIICIAHHLAEGIF